MFRDYIASGVVIQYIQVCGMRFVEREAKITLNTATYYKSMYKTRSSYFVTFVDQ